MGPKFGVQRIYLQTNAVRRRFNDISGIIRKNALKGRFVPKNSQKQTSAGCKKVKIETTFRLWSAPD